jgi:hypothetical protein
VFLGGGPKSLRYVMASVIEHEKRRPAFSSMADAQQVSDPATLARRRKAMLKARKSRYPKPASPPRSKAKRA